MSRRQTRSEITDPLKSAFDAVRTIDETVPALIEYGDLSGIDQLVKRLASALKISPEILAPLSEQARARIEEQRANTGRKLRQAAEVMGCEVQYRPPYVSVGCVTLHEKRPGEWSLAVLDGVVLETIRTTNGKVLAEHAFAKIEEIESALQKTDAFIEDLQAAREAVRGSATNPIPVNLLMVLGSHGRSLKKLLTSADNLGAGQGLSRAQFGYLLSRVAHQGSESGKSAILKLRFSGATQHDTKQPQHFIPIPDNSDPRRMTGHRRVTSVTISD